MRMKERIIGLLQSGPDMTYQEIGGIVGCSRQNVGEVARATGLTRGRKSYHRKDITVEKVLQLYHEGLFEKEIARFFGCSRAVITRRLRDAGITKHECHSRAIRRLWREKKYPRREDITVERVLNLYHDKLLVKEMAQTLGCSENTVRSRLRDAGISKHECVSRGKKLARRREVKDD